MLKFDRLKREIKNLSLRVVPPDRGVIIAPIWDYTFYYGTKLVPDVTFKLRAAEAHRQHHTGNPFLTVIIERNSWRGGSCDCPESTALRHAACPKRPVESTGEPMAINQRDLGPKVLPRELHQPYPATPPDAPRAPRPPRVVH
jgi:hypothetical protein